MFVGFGLLGQFMGTDNISGNDHTAVTFQDGSNSPFFLSEVQQQDWALG